jgi:putative transposase
MTENGDPRENAIAERLNGILKKHFGLKKRFTTHEDAKAEVQRAVKGYNNIRPHQSISMLTPEKAHEFKGVLKRMWKKKTFTIHTE